MQTLQQLPPRTLTMFLVCLVSTELGNCAASPAANPADATSAPAAIAEALAEIIAVAIPRQYERRDDWGKTTRLTTGLRTERDGWRVRVRRRRKEVPHGIWKHYRLQLEDPGRDLEIAVEHLRPLRPGHIGFTLSCDARLAGWIRVKTYQYGVHLGAYEVVGRSHVGLTIDLDIGLRLGAGPTGPAILLNPHVVHATCHIRDVDIERISDARGPLVREMGKGIRFTIERVLDSDALERKLNRAIEKNRHSLAVSLRWWDDCQALFAADGPPTAQEQNARPEESWN